MGEDKEEGKALWDTVEVKDESIDKRKGEERSSICDILTKSLIGICLGFAVLALAVIQYISFATMAHRESVLSHVGLEGVSHIGFMLAMILPDIRSFFYSSSQNHIQERVRVRAVFLPYLRPQPCPPQTALYCIAYTV